MHNDYNQSTWLGLNWQISPTSGWGVLGLNIALQAETEGTRLPVPLLKSHLSQEIPEVYRSVLSRIGRREELFLRILQQHEGQVCRCEFPVIHALGNHLASHDAAERITGAPNLAIIFFEDSEMPSTAYEVAKRFALIFAGSTWNCELLKKRGIPNVATLLQGVDLNMFTPKPRRSPGADHFLIFSGGKLEYRKGQDIVVAAFREFHRRHPNALLVTAWHNHWPQSMQGIAAKGHVFGVPEVNSDGCLNLAPWFEQNGVCPDSCRPIGMVPNRLVPEILHQMDVAVFPNRCEGGTNMAAMECLATGVPTILSANTGHLDLIDERHCYPLWKQGLVAPAAPLRGTEGWGESDVTEVVEALEKVYSDRAEAERRAQAAVGFMQDWSWTRRYEQLLSYLCAISF